MNSSYNKSTTSVNNIPNTTTGSSIVPVQVQRSIMEWLDEDLPNDSPARVARALGLPSHAFATVTTAGGKKSNNNNVTSSLLSRPSSNNRGGYGNRASNHNNNNVSTNSSNNNNNNNNNNISQNGADPSASSSINLNNNNNQTNSPNRPARRPGTRRQRQKEHTHVFVENSDLPAIHPANSIWLYGSYEYKLQTSPEEAQRTVFRIIGRLVERMQRLLDASTAAVARGDATSKEAVQEAANSAAIDAMMPTLPSTVFAGAGAGGGGGGGLTNSSSSSASPNNNNNNQSNGAGVGVGTGNGVLPRNHPLQGAVSGGRFRAKGHLVFDLISTRKHITQNFRNGLPYRLGEEIYEHCQRKFVDCIATCFVGLTDNPAQRVGRDIFYQKSDDLSTSHLSFTTIDYGHLFVVFPPDSKRLKETPMANSNSNNNNNNSASQNFSLNGLNDSYDESNTRFLIDALSGAHDLTGSTIPGRPPPLSALTSTRRQQEEAMFKVQQMKQQQQAQKNKNSSSSISNHQATTTSGDKNKDATTLMSATTADEASNLVAMHRQMFNNTPRRRQVNVQGSGVQKTHVWGSANSSPSNSPSPKARANSGGPARK